jgi:membrane-associated phospholipid phosphatase
VLGAIALGMFSLLAVAARAGPLPGDKDLTEVLAGHCPSVLITHAVIHQPCPFGVQRVLHDVDERFLAALFSLPVWTGIVLLGGVGLWRAGAGREALVLLCTDFMAEATTAVTKVLVARLPPPDTDMTGALASVALLEFPSGHMVRVSVTLGLLLVALGRARPGWRLPGILSYVTILGLVGVARVASEAHWPSDVVGSYLLSAASISFALSLPWAARPTLRSTIPRPRAGSLQAG